MAISSTLLAIPSVRATRTSSWTRLIRSPSISRRGPGSFPLRSAGWAAQLAPLPRLRRQPGLLDDRLLDVAELILAEEHLLADEERR